MTLISHFWTFVISFFLYVMCNDSPLYPNHSPGSSSLLSYWTSPHNVDPTKRLSASPYFYFPFISQQPTSLWPIFPQLLHPHRSGVFLHSYCRFCCHFYCCSHYSLTLYRHTCHNCYICTWNNCHSCCSIYFFRSSTLEPSLPVYLFPVISSVQFCIPEPAYLFLQIFKFRPWYFDVARYSDWLVLFR